MCVCRRIIKDHQGSLQSSSMTGIGINAALKTSLSGKIARIPPQYPSLQSAHLSTNRKDPALQHGVTME
jgi:hypothetical protein